MIGVPHQQMNLGRVLKWSLCVLMLAVCVWYVTFQARRLITGPSITLEDSGETVLSTRVTTIAGTADNITSLTLDGRPIFTDDDGAFREQLVLENGYTIMTLRAKDLYGREEVLTKAFVYAPAYTSSHTPSASITHTPENY